MSDEREGVLRDTMRTVHRVYLYDLMIALIVLSWLVFVLHVKL